MQFYRTWQRPAWQTHLLKDPTKFNSPAFYRHVSFEFSGVAKGGKRGRLHPNRFQDHPQDSVRSVEILVGVRGWANMAWSGE